MEARQVVREFGPLVKEIIGKTGSFVSFWALPIFLLAPSGEIPDILGMGFLDDLKKEPLTPERFNKYHQADREAALVTFRVLFIAVVVGMLSLLFFFFLS